MNGLVACTLRGSDTAAPRDHFSVLKMTAWLISGYYSWFTRLPPTWRTNIRSLKWCEQMVQVHFFSAARSSLRGVRCLVYAQKFRVDEFQRRHNFTKRTVMKDVSESLQRQCSGCFVFEQANIRRHCRVSGQETVSDCSASERKVKLLLF